LSWPDCGFFATTRHEGDPKMQCAAYVRLI
jgi:hypothetical protein